MEEEFRKNLGKRAVVSFGSGEERVEGKVVRVENSYVVLGEPPNLLYIPYTNMAYVRFLEVEDKSVDPPQKTPRSY